MSDWRTDEPPIGREIEFETDNGTRSRGVLKYNGTDQRYPRGKRTGEEYNLFVCDSVKELFRVLRWRELPDA